MPRTNLTVPPPNFGTRLNAHAKKEEEGLIHLIYEIHGGKGNHTIM